MAKEIRKKVSGDAVQLDDKGRCCGRKPIVYQRPPHKFCVRCDRAYDLEDGEQIDNWAYKQRPDGTFECMIGSA